MGRRPRGHVNWNGGLSIVLVRPRQLRQQEMAPKPCRQLY